MNAERFVPEDFRPPTSLVTDPFVLEPLGPQHNHPDLAAWSASIDHIRSSPGYPDGNWPPIGGMSSADNLRDLTRHARDFVERKGFTFTVLRHADFDVIGRVHLDPPEGKGDGIVQSWVRFSHAHLDQALADAVATWLAKDWPWRAPDPCGR